MENIQVSIVCNAYNHERYIRDAMAGFVMQKTNFPFEILVHDDASTDRTADIIREYEKKYPEIVKPIYETENQYSKHDGSLVRIQYGRVKGRYIAMCEGDDYWTDPLKLQKQYDALEKNPDVDICATGAHSEIGGVVQDAVFPASENTLYAPGEVIRKGGGFVATCSLMYRRSVRETQIPFFRLMNLDYTLQIAGSLRGGMLYLGDCTCVYREATAGSWTNRMRQNTDARRLFNTRLFRALRQLDEDTSGKYHNDIEYAVRELEFGDLLCQMDYRAMCDLKYKVQFREQPLRRRVAIRIGKYCPVLVGLVVNWPRRMR